MTATLIRNDAWSRWLPAFGTALARTRQAHGLSQSRLAIEAQIDHSYVSRLEAGRRSPSRPTLLLIADVLDTSPWEADLLLATAGYLPSPEGVRRLAEHLARKGRGHVEA